MNSDDMIKRAGQMLHQKWFAPRDASKPTFDMMPGNDLHPDTSALAFQLGIINDQVNALSNRVANIEAIIRKAQANVRKS